MGESLSDGHFLERWHTTRDGEAFYELVRRHSGMVYATSLRMLHNPHDAEEVVQDTFLALAQSPPRIESYAGPWLHRVATNRCLDRLKNKSRREQRERAAAYSVVSPGTVTWDDLQDFVDEAINALPEAERCAVVAHFLEGQTHEAIADTLGLTRQAVSHRIKRGIEAVRETLRKKGIAISTGALAILFAECAQATVPPVLAASLGKLSVAGAKHVTATGMLSGKAAASPTLLSAIPGSKIVAVVGMVLSVGAIGWFALRNHVPLDLPAVVTSFNSPLPLASAGNEQGQAFAGLDLASEDAPSDVTTATGSTAPASVSGKVTDIVGNPISGAQISVFTPGIPIQGPGPGNVDLAKLFENRDRYTFSETGPDGAYTVSNIALHGPALVGVNAAGYSAVERETQEIELQSGQEVENVDFVVDTGTQVNGIVLTGDGLVVRDAIIFCSDNGVALLTAADGTFSLGLPQGYNHPTLLVLHDAYGMRTFEDYPITEGHALKLVLHRLSSVRGRITMANRAPAAGYEVRLEAMGADRSAPKALVQKAKTDENGDYDIEGLPSNNYLVRIYDAQQSALSGPMDLGLLKAGEARAWNYIVQAPMHVHGTVREERRRNPMANQHVAWTIGGRVAGSVMTDAEGQYKLTTFAAPGKHLLIPNTTFLDINDELPDEWLPFAQSIQIAPGAERAIDLTLPDAFTAAVRFNDEYGEPITEGIRVYAGMVDTRGRGTGRSVNEDNSSLYAWDGFSPVARCYFEARPTGDPSYIYARVEVPTPNSLDEIVEVTARLYQYAELEGNLIGPDGAYLANQNFTIELQLANGDPYVLIGGSTSEEGYFHIQGDPAGSSRAIPATAFTMRIRWEDAGDVPGVWNSDLIYPAPGELISIGTVQLR
jgi:RNA polymerase sigma factor (sigma-70 family)